MKSLNVLIVEDELIIANDVSAHLSDMGVETAQIISRGEDALGFLKENKVDFILMDVALDGHLDGIDTTKLIKEKYDTPIVYMTANTDDMTFERAKATLPFAFIEKPFKKRTLVRTIELLVERLIAEEQDDKKPELLTYMLNDRIFVREKNALVKIYIKEILFIQAERAYCKIQTVEKEYLLSTTLKNFDEKVSVNFLKRVHRSFLVNLNKIDRIEDSTVFIGNHRIPVSRAYWDDLSSSLNII